MTSSPDGHVWKRLPDGTRDYHEPTDGHGGPVCAVCGYWYCEHCRDAPEYTCAEWQEGSEDQP